MKSRTHFIYFHFLLIDNFLLFSHSPLFFHISLFPIFSMSHFPSTAYFCCYVCTIPRTISTPGPLQLMVSNYKRIAKEMQRNCKGVTRSYKRTTRNYKRVPEMAKEVAKVLQKRGKEIAKYQKLQKSFRIRATRKCKISCKRVAKAVRKRRDTRICKIATRSYKIIAKNLQKGSKSCRKKHAKSPKKSCKNE